MSPEDFLPRWGDDEGGDKSDGPSDEQLLAMARSMHARLGGKSPQDVDPEGAQPRPPSPPSPSE